MNSALLPALHSLLCIAAALAALAVGQRRHWRFEYALLAASFVLACVKGIWPWEWAVMAVKSCFDMTLLSLLCALTSILLLSGAMDQSGQARRMAEGVKLLIHSTKIRLMFFPALVGLLPVPGGAVFSCPMVHEVARDSALRPPHLSAINYWFRHIWEAVWPLFPGFILYCALSELTPFEVITYNWPIWAAGLFAGWLCFLRNIPEDTHCKDDTAKDKPGVRPSRWTALKEGSSLLSGLAGAFVLRALFPQIPAGLTFAAGFCLGVGVCLVTNRLPVVATLAPILTSEKTTGILRVVIGIFIFKGVMLQSNAINALGALIEGSQAALFVACIILPILGGIFTGIQVGLVGITFPILVPIVQHAGLWDERIVWLGLASMCGYIGQMISPVHVCLIVTCHFFGTGMETVMRQMGKPCLILLATAVAWFALHVSW
ncbi:MAG TPA: DUF401 family protein [Candidatus Avidesulfovibrio excrementigallinarum]|nr:DUF401 family protein [Candidatus Avidesulfovibrio excrementigallinarum]